LGYKNINELFKSCYRKKLGFWAAFSIKGERNDHMNMNLEYLSEYELLSMSLRENPDSAVVKQLIGKINSMQDILELTMQELEQIEGMDGEIAGQFIAGMMLAKKIYSAPPKQNIAFISPASVAAHFMPQMRYLDREIFKCVYLNRKGHLICEETIAVGGLYGALIHPREVFKPAIARSACSIIALHNHPSGNPAPSKEDIALTQNLAEAGKVLGIDVLDHIIIGDGIYCSLREQKQM